MEYLTRRLSLSRDASRKSLFLFSPRQTGKTTLLKRTFPEARFYNLLLSDVFLRLSQRPQLIREELAADRAHESQLVIVDEIQKLPLLLDEVHFLIEEYGHRFILTGSSSRKLKRGGANLLGGRAWTRHLYPLVSVEVPAFDLERVLNFGAIPSIYLSDEPLEELAAYVGSYLQEEIQAEGLARNIVNFSRFLQTASLTNAEVINFEKVAHDAQVPSRTIREYFGILEDTLVGTMLEPFSHTRKRKAISKGKFYFFDVGVTNLLSGRRNVRLKTESFGKALEHFIFTELTAYLHYERSSDQLGFWRTHEGNEVDFTLGDHTAIEVKATELATERHLHGLVSLREEGIFKRFIVVSNDKHPRIIEGIEILPVPLFLSRLWQGAYRGRS